MTLRTTTTTRNTTTARAAMFAATTAIAITLAACSGEAPDAALEAKLADAERMIEDLEAQAQGLSAELIAAKQAPGLDLASGITPPPTARATMVNRSGELVGEALFWPASAAASDAQTSGVLMRLSVANVETNGAFHGLHFHSVGLCEGEDGFASASGHIMPDGAPHGFLNADGPHEGNLPNLYLHNPQSAFGFGVGEYYTTLVTLDDGPAGLLDADGASVIVHENTDDHATQPIGGAGGRIACGVVEVLSE